MKSALQNEFFSQHAMGIHLSFEVFFIRIQLSQRKALTEKEKWPITMPSAMESSSVFIINSILQTTIKRKNENAFLAPRCILLAKCLLVTFAAKRRGNISFRTNKQTTSGGSWSWSEGRRKRLRCRIGIQNRLHLFGIAERFKSSLIRQCRIAHVCRAYKTLQIKPFGKTDFRGIVFGARLEPKDQNRHRRVRPMRMLECK